MNTNSKIVNIEQLKEYIETQKNLKQKIVLCQGHFNVIHPGHLRFLEFAKQHGKILIVAVQGHNLLEERNKTTFFNEEERAKGVASLQDVNKVIVFSETSILDVISVIKPDVYVRGEEFSQRIDLISDEINLVEEFGGKVLFSSGQVEYATTEFLDNDLLQLGEKTRLQFKAALKKQRVSTEKLKEYATNFDKLNILVIGDTIVDQYIACDALGMSAEAPILNIRELESKSFIGGAAIVARHVKELGATCHFISVIGDDEPGNFVRKQLDLDGINTGLIFDEERQTTFKIRYMVGKQKILRVSKLQEHYINPRIEEQIISQLDKIADELDGIIVSDFAYGVLTPALITYISQLAKQHKIKLFGDSQSSSQIGDVSRFIEFDLITPTEREARIALGDKHNGLEKIGITLLEKTAVANLAITLAERGLISYQNCADSNIKSQHFPALNVNPLDVVGAGDSLLTGMSLAMCAGANVMEASAIGSGVASIAVNKVGNIPVKSSELIKWIEELSWINE